MSARMVAFTLHPGPGNIIDTHELGAGGYHFLRALLLLSGHVDRRKCVVSPAVPCVTLESSLAIAFSDSSNLACCRRELCVMIFWRLIDSSCLCTTLASLGRWHCRRVVSRAHNNARRVPGRVCRATVVLEHLLFVIKCLLSNILPEDVPHAKLVWQVQQDKKDEQLKRWNIVENEIEDPTPF